MISGYGGSCWDVVLITVIAPCDRLSSAAWWPLAKLPGGGSGEKILDRLLDQRET